MLTGATGPASPFASLCFQGQCSMLRVANKIFYTFIQALAIPPTLLSSFLFTSCRSGPGSTPPRPPPLAPTIPRGRGPAARAGGTGSAAGA